MKPVMKAEPIPGIKMGDLPVPRISPDEVLIRVKAAGICDSDVHIYEWRPTCTHLIKYMPIVLGHEFSGEWVEAEVELPAFPRGTG